MSAWYEWDEVVHLNNGSEIKFVEIGDGPYKGRDDSLWDTLHKQLAAVRATVDALEGRCAAKWDDVELFGIQNLLEMFSDSHVLLHGAAGEDALNVGDVLKILRDLRSMRLTLITPIKRAEDECRMVMADVGYGKDRAWRDGAVYAAERCLKRIQFIQESEGLSK
jgi:hypothetical protein